MFDYSYIYNLFRTNDANDTESPSLVMCLMCGEMISNQQAYQQETIGSNRVGTCTSHAYKCGRTVGMFLRVAECQILILHISVNADEDIEVRGCLQPTPYLDEYGETDQGLRRGNPLHLSETRYKKLHRLWLTHSIPDEVQRAYNYTSTALFNNNWAAF